MKNIEIIDKVDILISDIQKSKLAFNIILNKYENIEGLSLEKAVKFGSSVNKINEMDKSEMDSYFWMIDQKKIMKTLEIGFDYLLKAEEQLNKMLDEN